VGDLLLVGVEVLELGPGLAAENLLQPSPPRLADVQHGGTPQVGTTGIGGETPIHLSLRRYSSHVEDGVCLNFDVVVVEKTRKWMTGLLEPKNNEEEAILS
jgi:hypothetical protein